MTDATDKLEETGRERKLEQKIRRDFRKLTTEAQEEEFTGLTLNFRDERCKVKTLESEVRRLKELVKSFEGDQADVIRRQAQIIRHKESEMYRANDKAAAALRQVYVLKKLVKELENMGIEV